MKRMREIPPVDRPREKIAKSGARVLSDSELLEVILGRGTAGNDVRKVARDTAQVIQRSPHAIEYEDLIAIHGVGPSKASQILACLELGRRHYAPPSPARKIAKPEDVLPLVADMRDKRQEHFVCVSLNGAGEVIDTRTITVGLLNHSLVHPREVFADAITDRAASVICVHNHPSGSLEPSGPDIAITTQLREAGALLGIQLIDHILLTKTAHLSMRERGLL
jgi:DNA repair protein RadC